MLHPVRRPVSVCLAAILLAVGLLGLCLSTAAETTYTVRKYDTLSGIARDQGVSLKELASYNRIRPDTKVKVGQKLRIPRPAELQRPVSTTTLSSSVRSSIGRASVKAGRWKYLVVHHSGTSVGSASGMDRYHREQRHMENGLAYHFVIGNGQGMGDGEVAVGPRWTRQLDGGHLASEALNAVSLGICLVGNFEQEAPTSKQLRSLNALIQALTERCKLPRTAVRTHQEINPVYTRCPGRYFPEHALHREAHAHR